MHEASIVSDEHSAAPQHRRSCQQVDPAYEVEAALDDTNIGRFVELLRLYSDRAQFVVITHQKRTMEAADVLYGVTMGGDGVSQVVSRRLPREEAKLAGAA